jgi:diguanylate cyclase (GGDEF)-like protein
MFSERRSSMPRIDVDDTNVALMISPVPPCRVLIVDDDPDVVPRIDSLLKAAGYEVTAARSGTDALRALDTSPCQIVLANWHMPDMDGLALCKNLRGRQADGYIFVLMLTARYCTADILAGLAAGADDYVLKGATSAEILARLEVGRRTTHLDGSLRRSLEENRRMSVTDALTGAHNRRFLLKALPRELARSRRYDHPLAVISCDLDHFKRINDSRGHEVGDEILQAFVACANSCIRKGLDWIARTGGEEFLIVLPETGLAGASRAADRLRDAFGKNPVSTSSGLLTVTVSMGVTALETVQELQTVSVREFLRGADRYLFTSKHQGRDRATVAPFGAASDSAVLSPGNEHAQH